jgi:sugar phosphate isomerase/epimerase
MKIQFFCPRWGSESLPWDSFFKKVKDAGYDGVEMGFPPTLSVAEKAEIMEGMERFELLFIGQHWQTVTPDFKAHMEVFEEQMNSIISGKPLFINSQTGKDHFSMEQNLLVIKKAREISERSGVRIIHETHRGKWSFAAHITQAYLKKDTQIRLTLDASHWCNVAETYLDDQEDALLLAIAHTDHIHARVGHTEGPQVPDPRDPIWAGALNHHLGWWDKIVQIKQDEAAPQLTITAEFGAPPYTTLLPHSHEPIADQWEINCYMMDLLKQRYADV